MYHLKKEHMICFDIEEFKKLYNVEIDNMLLAEIDKSGYTTTELNNDIKKCQEIVDPIKVKLLADNTETEMVVALYGVLRFYSRESKLCCVLKNNFNPNETPIRSFAGLKEAIRQDQEVDFGILSGKYLRQFQLKRYRGGLNTAELIGFLKSKLGHYGDSLGSTNLLVILQCPHTNSIPISFFDKLTQELKALNLSYAGELLITFNANKEFIIIERIYPERGTAKIPFILPSQQ